MCQRSFEPSRALKLMLLSNIHVVPRFILTLQGESFREVMRRIQNMLEIQEKEFEKVPQTTV